MFFFFFFFNQDIYNPSIARRMNSLIPGWEVVGYHPRDSISCSVDYCTMIQNQSSLVYHMLTLEIGSWDKIGHSQHSAFQPDWFGRRNEHDWVWISEEQRSNVLEAAAKNHKGMKLIHYFKCFLDSQQIERWS